MAEVEVVAEKSIARNHADLSAYRIAAIGPVFSGKIVAGRR